MDENEVASGYHGRSTPRMATRSTGWLMSLVAEAANRRFQDALHQTGITAHQLGVLMALRAGPHKQARLAEQLGVVQPVMVTLVNELEQHGWAHREPHPTDRRAVEVHLTEAGQAKLSEAEAVLKTTEDHLFRALTPQERATFHQWLERMTFELEETP